jgi:hypothetical protein
MWRDVVTEDSILTKVIARVYSPLEASAVDILGVSEANIRSIRVGRSR